ncbi:tyrosine-type recombinase/integrase [Rhizobium leguminosarum]|uniref:Tyrosine-type recombinase/integrase n=1 Tax=Rhizobium leguminosarum TaxID=384 RepID=A0ACD5FFD9_RHILE|nr:tyrosine-type recombinase/integrase [Rhizobium leguminosarum]
MQFDEDGKISQNSLRSALDHVYGASGMYKSISPHVLRHSCAMHMLQATRDIRKVALWLGHATLQSTEIYLRADPTEKLEMLDALAPLGLKPGKFRPPDKLIAMLATR